MCSRNCQLTGPQADKIPALKLPGADTNDMDVERRSEPSQANLEMIGSGVYPLHR